MTRVLICGDRNWTDGAMIRHELSELLRKEPPDEIVVIEGEARGADTLGRVAAEALDIYRVMRFPADWDTHHKAAGPIRNSQMLTEGKPDVVWAFHDDLEHSKGTGDMVRKAEKAGVPVVRFAHPRDDRPADELGDTVWI